MLNKIDVGKWTFRYMVGPYTVGILTPSRKKHICSIEAITGERLRRVKPATDGMPDQVTPEEVARYVIANRLV